LEFGQRQNRNKFFLSDRLERGLPLKAAVAVVFIVEELKVLCLVTKISITLKPLGAKETTVIGAIEALHGSIPPRLSDGDKDDFDAQGKAKAQDDPKRTRMPIAAPKTQCVVELKKIGDAHGFPAANQALGDGFVVFAPLGLNKDSVAVKIDDMEGIESSIVFDVPGAEEVGLMDVVEIQRFSEIGVFDSFGLVWSFF